MNKQQLTVLIVDDSAEDRELYRHYLSHEETYFYKILEAELGEKGLELWQQHQPDIILLDYQLPDLDGLEFLNELQAQQSFLPVIVLTEQGNEAIAVQTLKAGAQNYLVKGQISPESLLSAVNAAIETVELRRQLQQRIERERLLAQIGQQIYQSLDLKEIFQTTVTEVKQFLKSDRVIIFRLFPDGNGTVIAESVESQWHSLLSSNIYDPCLAENNFRRDRSEGVTYDSNFNESYVESYSQGWVTAKSDIYDGSINQCHVELLARFQVRANLVVPILQDNQLWGLLIAHQCDALRQWQSLEIDLLQKLSTTLAIAIKQAELYQQAQREAVKRQRTEEVLRESEELLLSAIQVAGFAVAKVDYASNTVELSPEAAILYGLSSEELIVSREQIHATFHPEERAELARIIEQVLDPAGTGWFSREHRVVWTNGEVRWLSVRKQVFFDRSDRLPKPTQAILVALDVTLRKQTELALQESEERLRSALEASRMGTWDWNFQTGLIQWSKNLESLFGLEPGKFDGTYEMFVSFLHPQDRERVVAAIQHSLDTGENYDIEFRIVYPNGNIRWALSRGKVFYDRYGQPIRMTGNDLDITERKRIEAALRESEERFRQLAENIDAVFWLKEVSENRVSYVSPAYERLWGLNPQELYQNQQNWLNYIHTEERESVDSVFQEKAALGQFDEEYRIVLPNDSIRWVRDRCFPLVNESGEIYRFVGIAEDITVRKQTEIERDRLFELEQTAHAEAERANRIKDEFLAILSHELRSPLNPISGWVQLLQTREFDRSRMNQGLATIARNVKLQTQLIDDLLDVAKILRGKLSLNAIPLNLSFVIEAALDTVRTAAVAKSILITPNLPNIGQVSADSTRLQQIIWNLLSNAIKFTPSGGRVDISLERVDNLAQITVSDTGKGINSDFLPHIFEYFRQEDVSITRKHGGLGLGLAIVRHLVEAHGGTISADSPGENLGATFTIQLPLLNVEPKLEDTNERLEGELNLNGIRVLCVDDEPDTLEMLGILFTECGASVITVASAAEVLSTIESFQPDILISDIGMPEIDGYTLLQQIRSLPPEKGGQIPAIALTAFAGEIDQKKALSLGFQRHLTKPLDFNCLIQAIVALVKPNDSKQG